MRNVLPIFVTTTLVALVLTADTPSYAQQRQTHLGGRPSDLVTFFAEVAPGTTEALQVIGPDGQLGAFTLPAHTVLIVTDLIVSVNLLDRRPGVTRGGLINTDIHTSTGGISNNPYFAFDTTQQPSQTIHLTGGARWSVLPRAINAPDSPNRVFLFVYGYLANDR